MAEHAILIAGFGGQGILFAGKVLAQMGLVQGKNVSWLPSYGPEMRGGTASCSVMISDSEIGSPVVTRPTILIAMNQPSLERFAPCVKKGGIVIYDASLCGLCDMCDLCDICDGVDGVPATELGGSLANMVMLGKMIKMTNIATLEELSRAIETVIPAHKKEIFEHNIAAIKLGLTN